MHIRGNSLFATSNCLIEINKLLVKLGVAQDRLLAKGYGEQHPVGDNATETGRAQNRRISMLVTQKRARP
jgi:outer membrane protein OmpA-like peptidoglycan-associated protein